MASDKKCCVPGCFEGSQDDPITAGSSRQVLHLFPNPLTDRERFKVWTSSIGGQILKLDDEFIYQYRRVCHAHFEKKFWCRYSRLSNIAVPTINLPDITSLPCSSASRKRPFIQIENILMNVPSTSKDVGNYDSVVNVEPLSKRKSMDQETVAEVQLKEDCSQSKKNFKLRPRTLAENNLFKKLVAARVRISKYKNKIRKQSAAIKAAQNIVTDPKILNALENLPKPAKILTLMQFRENKKKSKGRRFTEDEKVISLSLLKQSPKGYRLLRKIFNLPAPQTLTKLITRANIHAGVNENIFAQLKQQAEKMKPYERLCILLFDEMALKCNITYNERNDNIIGFVNNGEEITKKFADHAQVFMIRGVMKNFKQPIGYTFSASATKGPELAKQIKLFIREITKAGFTVVATVCDQGSGNRSAIKYLIEESRATWLHRGEEPKKNIILIDNMEIVPLFDPPHLIKCIRNNLMVKDLQYTDKNEKKVAKWSHLEDLYAENPAYQGIRLIPKLSECHVKPAKISKMKVKYATQVFSQTVATNMGYFAEKCIIPQECKQTADILLFFDTLFDSVNGSYKSRYRHAKPALGPVTPKSMHHNLWRESKKIIESMKFLKKGNYESVPTLKNWIWTLDGLEVLSNNLEKKHGINSVWMRHLNQDPLENFFGSIRSHGCRNTNPTPERFQSAFVTLLINSLSSVHAAGNNCENDFGTSLHALVINKDCKAKTRNNPIDVDIENFNVINLIPIEEKINKPTIKASLQYCSGYFANMAKKKVFKNCPKCEKIFINQKESNYIKYREFQKKRWLCSPTKELILNISQMQDIIYMILKKKVQNNLIKEFIKTIILMSIDFDYIDCNLHKEKIIEYLINCVSRFFIYNYCKNINKMLCGKINVDDNEDMLQIEAKRHFDKSFNRRN